MVAKHPHHELGYAPGHTETVDTVRQTVKVRFFDGQQAVVQRVDVYRLPRDKYQHDVTQIQQRRQAMLGLSVVARDDETGEYLPGQSHSQLHMTVKITTTKQTNKKERKKETNNNNNKPKQPARQPTDGPSPPPPPPHSQKKGD